MQQLSLMMPARPLPAPAYDGRKIRAVAVLLNEARELRNDWEWARFEHRCTFSKTYRNPIADANYGRIYVELRDQGRALIAQMRAV